MNSDLQLLISALQEEHDFLENEMNECIKEWDFTGAELFKESLNYISEKLKVFKNLENPNYDELTFLRDTLERYRLLAKGQPYVERILINEYKDKLTHLEKEEIEFRYDNDEIINCLEKVVSDEIHQFQLVFEQDNIIFDLSKTETLLTIKLTRTDHQPLAFCISPIGLIELKKLGFETSNDAAKVEIVEFDSSKISSVIQLLSVTLFEALALYGNKQAVIKYKS